MPRSGSDNEIRAFPARAATPTSGHGNFTPKSNLSTPAQYPAHSKNKDKDKYFQNARFLTSHCYIFLLLNSLKKGFHNFIFYFFISFTWKEYLIFCRMALKNILERFFFLLLNLPWFFFVFFIINIYMFRFCLLFHYISQNDYPLNLWKHHNLVCLWQGILLDWQDCLAYYLSSPLFWDKGVGCIMYDTRVKCPVSSYLLNWGAGLLPRPCQSQFRGAMNLCLGLKRIIFIR